MPYDDAFMGIALQMARRGLGTTAPNPSVGAVVVDAKSGEILGRGWTQPGGRPHAEPEALARAGARCRGATVYVTLEPCAHHGRTPPCTEAIIAAGITRVVVGSLDPDERVAGRGIAQLRAAGIEVATGVRTPETHWMHLGHILRVTQNRPLVTLKLAVSADDRIAPGDGHPRWVTGPEARAAGHLLRARHDAILVGIGTVLADDPALTCRLPGMEARSPRRIVLDSHLRMPPTAALVRGGPPTTIFTLSDRLAAAPIGTADVVKVAPSPEGRLDPRAVAARLAADGVTRLLIEGGPTVAGAFLGADLVDEVALFRSSADLGSDGIPALPHPGLRKIAESPWVIASSRRLGEDTLAVYRNRRALAPEPHR
jgi:diaminohydroxyphosphoribosylaminopyrimidine deaminase/5-amino-6-(5-phosphoribosylamino)uracil reductase